MSEERAAPSFPAPEFVLWNLGQSVQARALDALAIAPRAGGGHDEALPPVPRKAAWPWILFLGGVHGDETEGIWLLEEMRARWSRSFAFNNVGVVVWAQVNPDGVARASRWNARNIDLNRNLPSKDWTPESKNPRYPPGPAPASEPENKALVKLVSELRPLAILSAHSFSNFQINANGLSNNCRAWAEALHRVCPDYPVTEDIGYPTPGSLGTYAGKELGIPTITLEIERGLPRAKVLEKFVPVLDEAVRHWDLALTERPGSP